MTAQTVGKNPSGRRQERTKMRARLKLTHPDVGELSVFTDNLSDGGLFILQGDHTLPGVGEVVQLQVQDVPVEAPILTAKVVRQVEEGIGVMFIDTNES